jgi:hypothetical protein
MTDFKEPAVCQACQLTIEQTQQKRLLIMRIRTSTCETFAVVRHAHALQCADIDALQIAVQ